MKRFFLGLAIAGLLVGCGGHKKKVLQASQRLQLATSKLGENDPEGALADLSEAHKLDPKNPEITNLLGIAYWAKARLVADESMKATAEKYILESFKQKGKDQVSGDWHNNLGALYVDMKRWGDAVVQLEMAIKDPEYRTPERAKNNLSKCYFEQGDCKRAEQYANEALRIQPKFCMALINKAKADECLKDAPGALESNLKAISECAEYPEPYLRAGTLYMKAGDKPHARDMWAKAKQLDPEGAVGKEAGQYLRELGK